MWKLKLLTVKKEIELQTGSFTGLNSVKGSDGKAFSIDIETIVARLYIKLRDKLLLTYKVRISK